MDACRLFVQRPSIVVAVVVVVVVLLLLVLVLVVGLLVEPPRWPCG